MGVLSGLFERYEFQAHFFGSLVKVPQHSLAIAFFVLFLALVGVLLPLGQHRIDQPRQLVCRGGDCLEGIGSGLSLSHATLFDPLHTPSPTGLPWCSKNS